MAETKTVQIPTEDLKILWKKSLDLLLYFQKICDANGLRFFLCGGSCIGAVRHKGFIPWDDDIDVFMLREDYEKLKDVWEKCADTKRYSYQRTSKTEYTRFQHTTIGDENTCFIKERQKDLDISHSIRIDVIPLDGCPSSRIRRKMQMLWALLFSLFVVGEPHESHGKFLGFISRILLLGFKTPASRYKIWRFAEKQMSKYPIKDCEKVTELCTWYQYMVNEYPKSAFASSIDMEFEGHMLPVPVGYDVYLKMAFGDYMQLPPPEKRVAKHDVIWYDFDHSYKQYKGRYYC